MSQFSIKRLKEKLKRASRVKKPVMLDAFEFFRKQTPKRTGFARRNTKLTNRGILADYPYAQVLDEGRRMTPSGMRGSRQAPDGMTRPTVKKFRQWIKKYIRVGQ